VGDQIQTISMLADGNNQFSTEGLGRFTQRVTVPGTNYSPFGQREKRSELFPHSHFLLKKILLHITYIGWGPRTHAYAVPLPSVVNVA